MPTPFRSPRRPLRALGAALVAALVTTLAACDTVDPDAFEPEYVVEAYLQVGTPLAPVRLGRSVPVGAAFEFSDVAVRDARVEVQLLGDDGRVADVFPYAERPSDPGVYQPAVLPAVLPSRRYRLEVTTSDGERITAETLTPGAIEVVAASADTVVYGSDEQLRVTLRRSDYAGRQNVYIFTTEALDARPEQLVPFYRRLYDQGDVNVEDLRFEGSPLLNEANYDLVTERTIEIALPWLAVAFYGPNRVALSAVDENLYDFIRSQQAQAGGSTLAPGEIPNILERVDGGQGVFGSYARAAYTVWVERE